MGYKVNPVLKRFLQPDFLILFQIACLFASAGRLNRGERYNAGFSGG
jgi:hypothetical protein